MAWVGAAPLSVSLRVDPMQQSGAGSARNFAVEPPAAWVCPRGTFALRLSLSTQEYQAAVLAAVAVSFNKKWVPSTRASPCSVLYCAMSFLISVLV